METTKQDRCNTSETGENMCLSFSRRHFFSLAGWGMFFAAMLGFLSQIFGYKGFFYPRVLFEPSPRFTIGKPDDFPQISVTKLKERRVFIVRSGNIFQAISVVCTHLGCAVEFSKAKGIFECPCHGSKYYRTGDKLCRPCTKTFSSF
jgi:cytochrome b6-f complex iron-sulfur subunit